MLIGRSGSSTPNACRDQNDERVLEDVAVECVEKLGPEKWGEAPRLEKREGAALSH
jgi:hypothetical protein